MTAGCSSLSQGTESPEPSNNSTTSTTDAAVEESADTNTSTQTEGSTTSNAATDEEVANAKAEEKVKAKEEAERKKSLKKKIKNARFPSKRKLAKIIRDPDSHMGEVIRVWGEVIQYDSATGNDTLRADIAHKNTTSYSYFSGENAMLMGDEKMFSDLIEGDLFTATVQVSMSYTYDTTIGGSATVPLFTVLKIKRQ